MDDHRYQTAAIPVRPAPAVEPAARQPHPPGSTLSQRSNIPALRVRTCALFQPCWSGPGPFWIDQEGDRCPAPGCDAVEAVLQPGPAKRGPSGRPSTQGPAAEGPGPGSSRVPRGRGCARFSNRWRRFLAAQSMRPDQSRAGVPDRHSPEFRSWGGEQQPRARPRHGPDPEIRRAERYGQGGPELSPDLLAQSAPRYSGPPDPVLLRVRPERPALLSSPVTKASELRLHSASP